MRKIPDSIDRPLRQVAVRMSEFWHREALAIAKQQGETFGEFVRKAVAARCDKLRFQKPRDK